MELEKFNEYLELISTNSMNRLKTVFDIFNSKLKFFESETNIYAFHDNYFKEITVLEEFGIIEWDFDEDEDENYYEIVTSQLNLAKIEKMFNDHNPINLISW